MERLGPFDIERELGRGGMGVVYAARWDGREVALKVAQEGLDEREKKRFLEEAELVARVSHPAVVELYDSGTLEDGRPYLVMPLVAGETLAARLARGPLDPAFALRLFAQLAAAVALLHEAGIVHRDIKPENVMILEDEERLVLLDFGIAREIDASPSTTTRMNLVRGTPACMAPERFFGTRASASSDVYELGVVLYAMLTGMLPWDDPTDPEARLSPRDPSALGIALPAGVVDLLFAALSTRPDRRPTASDLAAQVRAIEQGAPIARSAARTTAALPIKPITPLAFAPTEMAPTPRPERARSVVPPPEAVSVRPPWWLVAGLAGAVGAVAIAFVTRTSRGGAAETARAGLGARALATMTEMKVASTATASTAPTANPDAESSSEPKSVPTAAASAAPVSTPVQAATAQVATAAPIANPGTPWCTKLAELYCTPAARKMPGGDARCDARRAGVAKMKDLPAATRARAEAQCKESIPAVEKSIRTPQGSENPDDMPWCKRVAAAYCSPEVRASQHGDALCAQGQAAWGPARIAAVPPALRAQENEKCAQLLPSVVAAMKEHVRNFGPAQKP